MGEPARVVTNFLYIALNELQVAINFLLRATVTMVKETKDKQTPILFFRLLLQLTNLVGTDWIFSEKRT